MPHSSAISQSSSLPTKNSSTAFQTRPVHPPAKIKATYYGLFPRAWTSYEEPLPGLRVSCKQVSPVVPHDYATSSLPAAALVWTVENVSKEPMDVSMMFTFQNGDGGPGDRGGGHRNSAFATAPEAGGGASSARAGAKAGAAEEKTDAARGDEEKVVGVALAHMHRQRRVFNPEVPSLTTPPLYSTTRPSCLSSSRTLCFL